MICASVRRTLALAAFSFLVLPAAAQVRDAEPIQVKAPKPKKIKYEAEVISATRLAITVRDLKNANLLRTFKFSPKLAPKMTGLIDEDRGFQHGDRVVIVFLEGTETALKIKGKPRQHH